MAGTAIPRLLSQFCMKQNFLLYTIAFLLVFLPGCRTAEKSIAPVASATPAASPTPDPCSAANLPYSVKTVNDLMRQFDDYAVLASNTRREQLFDVIPPMQAVRRSAEDLLVPPCLEDLKRIQLQYMETMLQTLLAFLSNPQSDTVSAGMVQARQQHDQYTLEIARLLGLTVVPARNEAEATSQAPQTTSTPAAFTVINATDHTVNVRASASMTSQKIGVLNMTETATAIGKSANDEWVLITLAGQNGWVYATLIQFLNGDLASLPIITP